jgi:hypothetical protein
LPAFCNTALRAKRCWGSDPPWRLVRSCRMQAWGLDVATRPRPSSRRVPSARSVAAAPKRASLGRCPAPARIAFDSPQKRLRRIMLAVVSERAGGSVHVLASVRSAAWYG